MAAIEKRLKVSFDYRNREGEETQDRLLTPLAFIVAKSRVFLVGHCYLRSKIRQFAPERMENVRLTNRPVAEDFDFDPKAYAESSLGGFHAEPENVLLRISPWMRDYFARNLSFPDQRLFEEDGEHFLRFRLGPNWSLVWWISQFGPNVEILESEHLCDWVAEFLAEAAAQYDE